MTRDDFMAIAWRDFLAWAIGEAGMREAFVSATGKRLDEDGGTAAFVEWATVNHWGLDEAPASYRAEMAARA